MNYSAYFEVKRKIELLKKLSDRNALPATFAPLLHDIFFDKLEIKSFDLGEQLIYRARRNEAGRLFTDIGELKYPRYPNAKGRMNDVGERFFYGATSELGTIYELVPAIGSLFTISKVHKKNGRPIFLIAGLLDDPLSPTPKNPTEKIIYDYLHGELVKVTSAAEQYNSTIAISKHLLSKGLNAQDGYFLAGLVYPSVQLAKGIANVRTFNIGMKGDVFDENFGISEVLVYCLTDEVNTYQLNEVNQGKLTADGHISWIYSFPEMRQRVKNGLTSDGSFVAKLKSSAELL